MIPFEVQSIIFILDWRKEECSFWMIMDPLFGLGL